MTANDNRSRFRADVEGLRGVAVLAVVCYHARIMGWSGGFVGVDVFFVISGYLITGLLVRELERTGRVNLREFFARRIRRLLPASLVMLGATVVAAAVLLSPGEQVTVARTARATAVYLSNVFFLANASDYFAAANDVNPLLHTWSLAVEEQFYLVWPLLLLVAFRSRLGRRSVVGLIGAISVVSLIACVVYTRRNVSWAFFGTPFRAWEFGVGALASLVPATLAVSAGVRRSVGGLGAVAIAAAVFLFTRATPFPGVAAMLPVAGTAAVLWAGSDPTPRATRWLQIPPLTAMGRLSYSWYLWHWPVLVFGAVLWPELSQAGRVALAALSLGLAAVSYVAVERPIRLDRRLRTRPRLTIAFAGASSIVWVVGASALRSAALRDAQSPAQRAITDAERIPSVYGAHCINEYGDSTIHACTSGDPTGHQTVVLFGDSHAAQWAAALDVDARRRGWRLVLLLKSSCPAAALDVRTREGSDFADCPVWRTRALADVARLRPAVVIVSSARTYIGSETRRPANLPAPITPDDWTRGYRTTLAQLARSGSQVVFLHDNPTPGFDVPTCLARARTEFAGGGGIVRSLATARYRWRRSRPRMRRDGTWQTSWWWTSPTSSARR